MSHFTKVLVVVSITAPIVSCYKVASEPAFPVVLSVVNYATVIQARQASNSSWYNLSQVKQTQIKVRLRSAARASCDKLAIFYKKTHPTPELIPADIRGYYNFHQNPVSFSKRQPNTHNVLASPQLVKISERIIKILPDGKIISETSFRFDCHGAYYNTNPGANN